MAARVARDEAFDVQYGRLRARLRAAGRTIDARDLLIATAAVIDGAPIITRNGRHVATVPGLQVIEY